MVYLLIIVCYLTISPIVPGATLPAFDSSVSICIASAKLGLTRTTTSPKIKERPFELTLTDTTSLSSTFNSFASSGVQWI